MSSQYKPHKAGEIKINDGRLTKAYENVFEVSFEQFKDTIIPYLPFEEDKLYNSSSSWDEIRLKVSNFIKEFGNE